MTAFRIYIFLFSLSFSLFASSPTSLKNKKLSVSFSVSANSSTGTHEFYILNGVDVAGYYWKISNDPQMFRIGVAKDITIVKQETVREALPLSIVLVNQHYWSSVLQAPQLHLVICLSGR